MGIQEPTSKVKGASSCGTEDVEDEIGVPSSIMAVERLGVCRGRSIGIIG